MLHIKCSYTGSWGNLYFINFNGIHFIIEVGVHWNKHKSEVLKSEYVFITHEHGDHCGYLKNLLQHFPLKKVFWTKGTKQGWLKKNPDMKTLLNDQTMEYGETVVLKDQLEVTCFKSYHDTLQPSAWMFKDLKTSEVLFFITDCGTIPKLPPLTGDEKVYCLIEGNYDQNFMIRDNVKDMRSLGPLGHLSIQDTHRFIKSNKSFKWFGLIHGSTTKLKWTSDLIFKNLKNVERIHNGWEREFK